MGFYSLNQTILGIPKRAKFVENVSHLKALIYVIHFTWVSSDPYFNPSTVGLLPKSLSRITIFLRTAHGHFYSLQWEFNMMHNRQ